MTTIKDEDITNLPAEKQDLLRMAASFAHHVEKLAKPKGRSEWRFHFDEGAYQGATVIGIAQNRLTARTVIDMLEEVGWPGFRKIVEKAEKAAVAVLQAEALARKSAA